MRSLLRIGVIALLVVLVAQGLAFTAPAAGVRADYLPAEAYAAFRINNSGIVVGCTDYGAFVWNDRRGLTEFGQFPYEGGRPCLGLNNGGDVVATMADGSYLLRKGKMNGRTPLQLSWVYAVNDRGDVGGALYDSQTGIFMAAIQTKRQLVDLGIRGAVTAINNSGVAVINHPDHAYIYARGKAEEIVVPPYCSVRMQDINDDGMAVGYYDYNWQYQGFVYEKGVRTDLQGLPGSVGSYAYAINNRGDVAGCLVYHYVDDYNEGLSHYTRACIWRNGNPPTLIGPPGLISSYAYDINDKGDIVGWQYSLDQASTTGMQSVVWSTNRLR